MQIASIEGDGIHLYTGKHIYGVHKQTGKQLWAVEIEPAHRATPLISDNMVFVPTMTVTYVGLEKVDQGYLYAIDVKSFSHISPQQ